MNKILIFFLAYFAILAALLIWARPYQVRIQKLGAALRQQDMSAFERRFIEGIVSSSYSWRSAIVSLLAFTTGMFQSGDTLDRECDGFDRQFPALASDPRVHQLMEAHFAAAVAANPVVGAFAIIMRHAFRLKVRLHHDAKSAEKISDFRGLGAQV